jgi:hypothetical protein
VSALTPDEQATTFWPSALVAVHWFGPMAPTVPSPRSSICFGILRLAVTVRYAIACQG